MKKAMKSSLLVILCLMSVPTYGEKLSKCTPVLEYLYNYYYDPGALKTKSDSSINANSMGSATNDTIMKDSSLHLDTSATKDTGIPDSVDALKNLSDNSAAKVREKVELGDITTRKDRPDPDPFDNPSLLFKNDIPYLDVIIEYTGDGTDLTALGVEYCCHFGEILIAKFPLSILPEVDSLPTVIRILSDVKLELNEIQSQSNNDSFDIATFIELH